MYKIKIRHKLKQLVTATAIATLSLTALPLTQLAHAAPAPTDAPSFVSRWDTKDLDGNDNDCPSYIAVDSVDNTYMSSFCSGYVSKFDTNGDPVLRIGQQYGGGGGNGLFGQASGIAVDSQGNIYVADTSNQIVQKFSSGGTYLSKLGANHFYGSADGQFTFPIDVAVDSQDNVYVADRGNYRIQKFNSNGTFLAKFGSYGTGNGQFEDNSLTGVAVDSQGNVYAVDLLNNRVEKFDSNGNYLSEFGGASSTCSTTKVPVPGTDDGKLCHPRAVAVDSQDNVYVTDRNNRVEKFDSNGNYLSQFGTKGNADGQFSFPYGIAIDSKDNIYVGDDNGIQKFAYPDSTTLSSAPAAGSPVPNAVSLTTPAGTTITCSLTANEIAQTSQDSNYIYPLGLVNFCFTSAQASNEVVIVFQTDLKPSQVIPRKYNPTTKQYSNLPSNANATITETTLSSKPALKLTYTITDNGELDNDPTLGSIKDPIGLATTASTTNDGDSSSNSKSSPASSNSTESGDLADTGINVALLMALATGVIVLSATTLVVLRKKQRILL